MRRSPPASCNQFKIPKIPFHVANCKLRAWPPCNLTNDSTHADNNSFAKKYHRIQKLDHKFRQRNSQQAEVQCKFNTANAEIRFRAKHCRFGRRLGVPTSLQKTEMRRAKRYGHLHFSHNIRCDGRKRNLI